MLWPEDSPYRSSRPRHADLPSAVLVDIAATSSLIGMLSNLPMPSDHAPVARAISTKPRLPDGRPPPP
eukprot:9382960-Pyramimonas_sp.AAC.1